MDNKSTSLAHKPGKKLKYRFINMKIFMQLIISSLFVLFTSVQCTSPNNRDNTEQNILTLITKIDLPNVSGRIDHIAFDSINQLAFIAALGNNTIEVVNINTNKVVYTIHGLHEPQGVVFIPSLQRLVVANGDDGSCVFYDTKTYSELSTIQLKGDADNIRYDKESNLLFVGYGSGAIAIIDAIGMKLINSIPLDGHPESFQPDKEHNKLYINVPDADEVEVADLHSNKVIATWKNTNASSNFPMALDEENNRIFIACRNPATLRMINIQTGKDIQSISCSRDADDLFYFDNLIFVSAGKGYIDVFQANNNTAIKQVSHLETRSGARTSLLLPNEKKLLLAVPAHNGEPAAIWVYAINK